MQTDASFYGPGGSFITLSDSTLRAGTPLFERSWRISAAGFPDATSFLDRVTGVEWIAVPWNAPAHTPADPVQTPHATLQLAQADMPEADSLVAELHVTLGGQGLVYRLQVFPELRGVRIRRCAIGAKASDGALQTGDQPHAPTGPSGVETDPLLATGSDIPAANRLDAFVLSPQHLRLVHVSLQDQTDEHNELVSEREWLLHPAERPLALTGCLFHMEDPLTASGLIFCKEAPLPHARPVPSPADLVIHPAARRIALVAPGPSAPGSEYLFTTLAYGGGKFGRIQALHAYQRALRPYIPGRDGLQLSNTWGDRNRDGRINAAFLRQEIAAGADLGIDVIQIDDGWQAGATSNSVRAKTAGGIWEGYYAAREDFWTVHSERFPQGLAPLIAEARQRGLRFGLWFSPDSSHDFANWSRDVQTILALYRNLGVDYFKIDGVNARTPAGGRNLQALFAGVLAQTQDKVVLDLDVTAQVRPGYFGQISIGPLFVENRYTDWHRYWPHHTLRNLWKLSHHVDPLRLRMEWLNNQRHMDQYRGDPLAPAAYRPDCLFATVMFASPLGWFEVSNLPAEYLAEAGPLIAVWKAHRERIHRGVITPIGEAPDGVAWTGFLSISADGLYVLAFRELNPSPDWEVPLPHIPSVPQMIAGTGLGGDGSVTLGPGRVLQVHIPDTLRFVFARIEYGARRDGKGARAGGSPVVR